MAKIMPDDAVARWTMENGWWPYTPTGRFRKRYGAVVDNVEDCFERHLLDREEREG